MSPPRSKIWQSFTKLDSVTAACKICFKHIKTSGNTSNLAKHLKQHRGSSNASSSSIIIDSESETGLSESDVIAGPSSTPGSPSSSKRLRYVFLLKNQVYKKSIFLCYKEFAFVKKTRL